MRPEQSRTYDRTSSVVFLKTNEPFGGLSNMAGGFGLRVNGMRILTSEALYQACRFPHRPEVQRLIIEQRSPMTAKMKSKPYRHDSRPDWDQVRVKIMRWSLRVKLAQNWHAFRDLLLETGERPIVEESWKDDFWGAKPTDDGRLVGMNVLGRLLMELREAVKDQGRESLMHVKPLAIPDFLLGGRPIEIVAAQTSERDVELVQVSAMPAHRDVGDRAGVQPSLFGEQAVKESPSPMYIGVGARGVCIADLKPYAEYKKSGSTWLGAVPAKWEVRNLRTLISKRAERDRADLPLLSVAREKGVFMRSLTDADENHNVIPEDLSNYKVARAGNLVINKMKAWQGSMGIAPCDGIVSPAYFVFDFRIANHAFGQRLLRSKPYVAHFGQASDGVRVGQWDLSIPGMRQIPVLVPPPAEQTAIVRFLDWANGRLERAIRAKRKVIALLNEQKQAIIHRAVTRGLDPAVPLKPSGIPWLGDIPQHWEALQVRRVVSFVTSGSRGWAEHYSDDGLIFLQSGNLGRSMSLNLSYVQHVRPPDGAEGERTRIRRDDVLICVTGALTGNVVLVDQDLPAPAFVNQHVALVRPKPKMIEPRFLAYVLHSEVGRTQFKTSEYGGTKQGLGLDDVKSVFITVPLMSEQGAICSALDTELGRFKEAISRLEREIELLREYRTRLVADVVTGKLDVRKMAASLPGNIADAADSVQESSDVETIEDDLEEIEG